VGDGTAVVVEDAPTDDDAFSERFTGVLAGEVVVVLGESRMSVDRAGDLRQSVGKEDERL
jgi:hypothetical protein